MRIKDLFLGGLTVRYAVCLMLLTAVVSAEEIDEYAAKAWEQSRDDLTKILRLDNGKSELPRSALIRRDQKDVDEDIAELLDKVIEALEVSSLTECRQKHAELEQKIMEARREIAERQERKIFAPKDGGINIFTTTQDDYGEQIEALQEQVAKWSSEQDQLVVRMQEEYAKIGIKLSTEQVKFYLSSVSGENIAALSAIFHNVKQLNAKLEELVKETPGDAETAKRYYGIHVVMVQAIVRAHEEVLKNIEQRYLPGLDTLSEQNKKAARETQHLLEESQGSEQQRLLVATERAQETTDQAITLYRKYLMDHRDRVRVSLDKLSYRYRVAKNAYDTVRVAAGLIKQMNACIKDLDALRGMHLPDLVPINSAALAEQFGEITTILERSEPR